MSNVQRILNLYKEGKISESTIIKMAAFKAELEGYLKSEDLEKSAAFDAKSVLLGALAIPTLAAGTFMLGKGVDMLESKGRKLKREEDFKRMLEVRPELKAEDPLLIRKYWDSLVHFAPAIARDPLAAGAYIKQTIQYEEVGGPPYSTIESLVKTQKGFRDSQPLSTEGFGEIFANNPSSKT